MHTFNTASFSVVECLSMSVPDAVWEIDAADDTTSTASFSAMAVAALLLTVIAALLLT